MTDLKRIAVFFNFSPLSLTWTMAVFPTPGAPRTTTLTSVSLLSCWYGWSDVSWGTVECEAETCQSTDEPFLKSERRNQNFKWWQRTPLHHRRVVLINITTIRFYISLILWNWIITILLNLYCSDPFSSFLHFVSDLISKKGENKCWHWLYLSIWLCKGAVHFAF